MASGSGNTITGNKGGDLCGNVPLTLVAQPLPEGTADQVNVPADVPTLQEAVNMVRAGGTITVAADQIQVTLEGVRVTGGRGGVQVDTGPSGTVTLLKSPG